jgi:uncharacterized protein
MSTLIGRDKERTLLQKILKSDSSEFVAVYGRRRVGKTYLIRETFSNTFHFHLTGLANATLHQQLVNFHIALNKKNQGGDLPIPTTWFDAFQQLITLLEKNKDDRKVIFIDELPWLDTPKSNCVSAVEHFWNSWASARKDIVLIVCGSAASWMLNKLLNNKGGLHNRVTQKIKLLPFTLGECEQFLVEKKINWNRYQIVEAYMAMGGIPYYWNAMESGYSAAQNIAKLFFSDNGLLKEEFQNLFASLFKNSQNHVTIVEALGMKAKGLSREEIIKYAKWTSSGTSTKILDELEVSGFIRKYTPLNKKVKQSIYQLTDLYSLFYLRFIKDNKLATENFWINAIDSPQYRIWSGYSFEMVCLLHTHQLKKKLGIHGMQSSESSWRSKDAKDGAQIDLVIDRKDETINICEMKFSINPFSIDKKYAENLRNKIGTFRTETKTRKAIMLTVITTYGLNENEYSLGLVQHDLTMDCLFE